MKVIVYHSYYGCETGCCGHVVEVPEHDFEKFSFAHPYDDDDKEWAVELAQEIVDEEFGKGHTVDLDWENSRIIDD